MNRIQMLTLPVTTLLLVAGIFGVNQLSAQDPNGCVQYEVMPRTIYEAQKVTAYREVMETQYETRRTTVWKPVWTTETRQRRTTVRKPVTETGYREDTYTVLKPITETGYREDTYEETTWETTTEMREEQFVEEKPVVETSFREEEVVTRKPVTETMMRSENVTLYRPVTSNETAYVPGAAAVNTWGVVATRPSTRLRWLPPSYYVDPTTGQTAFRRRGLHWLQSPSTAYYVPQTSVVPTLTPHTVQRTSMVPQTYVQKQPVEVTRFVDEVTTRRVPVETYRTERIVTTRKVPVEVRKPVKRYVTKRVPVERVRYQKQEVVRRVPVTRQRFETVSQTEQYDVQVCRWEQVEREVRVPKVVKRRIPFETTQMVPRTVLNRVPVDAYGRRLMQAPNNAGRYSAAPAYNTNPYATNPNYSPDRYHYGGDESGTVISSRSLMNDDSVASEGQSDRTETARPEVEIREVPGSTRIVFPESDLESKTDLVDVTPRKPAEDQGSQESKVNDEFVGEIERGARKRETADTPPSLGGDEEKEDDQPTKAKPDGEMPGLDAPKEPAADPSEDEKPSDPVDT